MESRKKIRPMLDSGGKVFYPLTHSMAVSDSNGTVHDKLIAIQNQFETYVPIEITGDVTNAPDEEDITSENNLLKLKNRNALSGKGYVILRSGEITPQLTQSNTIYEVRYNHDIADESPITLPPNCVLYFNGGMITGGTLIGDNTVVDQIGLYDIFENITREGTWVFGTLAETLEKTNENSFEISILQTTTENHTEEIGDLQSTTSGHTSDIGNLQTAVGENTEDIENLQTSKQDVLTFASTTTCEEIVNELN